MKNNIKRNIIVVLGTIILLLIPISAKATTADMQREAVGVKDALQGVQNIENTDSNDAVDEIKSAAKRGIITVTVCVFGGIILVLCILYKRQNGVRI